ncbi:MAG TPA: M20/M25/M40 family metallo-hydrolase, partial [Thermoanaerobaculia bacterium]|nr:M20/M25/M40 family metallo-hydrolase [Thermoanaerobaculia bacterium]
PPAAAEATAQAHPGLLTNARQLTFEGRRAGEGYFSPDGRRLVFQSERQADNPFFQIYTLHLGSGDVERVSTGVGKTTCAFYRPGPVVGGSHEVLFASTHHDPASRQLQARGLAERAAGTESRYAWDYDPEMELYVGSRGTGGDWALRRLTHQRGYDAEAAFSPDGEWIVFTSNRQAFERELSSAEAKRLEVDPAYFAEIYRVRADGSALERLTDAPGYDGGPFYFADGSRIVWRRFDEKGLLAEVYTMRPDGTDVRRLTDLGAMSWAPYPHPSGEYVIFASNELGFGNFELYLVDAEGRREPVRVTASDGFDGLPVFSPDGTTLVWTSNRGGGHGQLFTGDWSHERARSALAAAPLRHPGPGAPRPEAVAAADDELAVLRRDVAFLASPELAGRLTGSEGERRAAAWLAGRLAELGARPLPGEDDFLLPFDFTAGTRDAGSRLQLAGAAVSLDDGSRAYGGTDTVQALSFSDSGEAAGEVVFAGYGLVVPDGQGVAYDSYAGLDVTDKIVLVLRYFPEDAAAETRAVLARYSGLRYKALHAREQGARALLVVTGPRSPNAGETVPMSFDTAISGSGLLAASVSGAVGEALMAAAGKELAAVQESLDDANPHAIGFPIPGVTAELTVAVDREQRVGTNVAGYLPATVAAPGLERPWLVLGAHYDHLGHGEGGNSLAGEGEVGRVHHGADDNASGVAAVLAIGRRLAALEERSRPVVLAFWSGEELGLLGSSAFVAGEAVPSSEIAAYLNFDMVGRLADGGSLTLQAVGTSPAWPALIERANVPVGLSLTTHADPYLPTDSASFDQAGVPTLNFFTGSHADYHRPSDTAEKVSYEGIDRIARFAGLVARRLVTEPAPPEFVRVERNRPAGGDRDTLRAFTGTIPDYTTEVEGLRLSGVVGGGPAEEAGLREGDVIVELAGQTIANIYDYTYALDAVKIGQPAAVVYLRDGERRTTTIVPRARD